MLLFPLHICSRLDKMTQVERDSEIEKLFFVSSNNPQISGSRQSISKRKVTGTEKDGTHLYFLEGK